MADEPTESTVLLDTVEPGITRITLNRPSSLNSMNRQLIDELHSAFDVVDADPDVRVVLLTGAGNYFSVGGDVKAMSERPGGDVLEEGEVHDPMISRRLVTRQLELDKPIVCAIEGDCAGLAATIALLCDITVMSEDARIGDSHVNKVGLVAGDGGSWLLPRVVGLSKAYELALREANTVFESSYEGLMVVNADGRITKVNPAFVRITGYAADEVVGQSPRILSSGRQGPEFYQQMWAAIARQDFWQGEIWNRRKSGEIYAELLSISVVRGVQGAVEHYVAVFSDISRLKAHEAELDRIAHYDPLTGVPNRRLLADVRRLHAQHRGRYGSPRIHAALRAEWFAAVSAERGTEVLAVQTLRNSLMSATMIASTAAIGLMGAATLVAPSRLSRLAISERSNTRRACTALGTPGSTRVLFMAMSPSQASRAGAAVSSPFSRLIVMRASRMLFSARSV